MYRYSWHNIDLPGPEQAGGVLLVCACLLLVGYLLVKWGGKSLPMPKPGLAPTHHRHICLLVLLDHGAGYSAKFAKLIHQADLASASGRTAALNYLQNSINPDDILDSSVLFGDLVEEDSSATLGARALEEQLARLFGAPPAASAGEQACLIAVVGCFPGHQEEKLPNTAIATLKVLASLADGPSTSVGICTTPEPGRRLLSEDGSRLFEAAKQLVEA